MELENFLKHMYSTPIGMAAADKDGHLIQSNGAFDDLIGTATIKSIWELLAVKKREDTVVHHISTKKHWGDETGLDLSAQLQKQDDGWWSVRVTTSIASAMPNYVPYQPSCMLKEIFDRVMVKPDGLPLFQDWDTYEAHLPYRQSSSAKWQRLADYPFYARKQDMELFTAQIETTSHRSRSSRPPVKYIVAPSGSGKTASVAAAFITSVTEGHGCFSHYLYMAFENNKNNNFKASGDVSKYKNDAEKQGACFAFDCLKKLLNDPKNLSQKSIVVVNTPPDLESTAENIRNLVDKVPGERQILLHLDEHRKMHEEAHFRRGAMGILASASTRLTVVATYIDPPIEIPEADSSVVCRYPLALPALDIRAVMKNVKELCLPIVPSVLQGPDQRLWATLLFRLAAYVSYHLSSLHLRDDRDFVNFLKKFQGVCDGYDKPEKVSDTLKMLFELCPKFANREEIPNECEAFNLLLGMTESELAKVDKRVGHGLVAFPIVDEAGGIEVNFSTSVQALASYRCKKKVQGAPSVCQLGALLFKNQLNSDDLLAETPLERAYLWTLATRSAVEGQLELFSDKFFDIECGKILPGRIFVGTTKESLNLEAVKKLKTNAIYYADENHEDVKSHPYGDIFFLTPHKELVLIDVTGATRKKTVNKKEVRLGEWVKYSRALNEENLTFHGVVLAPLLDGKESKQGPKGVPGVSILKGPNARQLLGGLTQLLAWFAQDV